MNQNEAPRELHPGFMNSHEYNKELINHYPEICTFNCFKPKYVANVKSNLCYNSKDYLQDRHPVPGFITAMDMFYDENGRSTTIPDYVIDQIRPAIASINVHPSRIKLSVSNKLADCYVFYIKYKSPIPGPLNLNQWIIIELEYVFRKHSRVFDGYFSKNVYFDDRLPRYEIVKRYGKPEELFVYYGDDDAKSKCSSANYLNVRVKFEGQTGELEGIRKLLNPGKMPLGDELGFVPVCMSLREAVIARLFPTWAHYTKFCLDDETRRAERDFHKYMKFTPMKWHQLPQETRTLYCNYALRCMGDKRTRPLLRGKPDSESQARAIYKMRQTYPFLIQDSVTFLQDVTDCVLDIWESYFGGAAIPASLATSDLPAETRDNMSNFWFEDPVKHARVIDKFQSVRKEIAAKDFGQRVYKLKLLLTFKGVEEPEKATLLPEDVAFFNRFKTNLPKKWRYYLSTPSVTGPREMGADIMKRKAKSSPTSVIESINFTDVESEQPLTLVELMTKVDLVKANHSVGIIPSKTCLNDSDSENLDDIEDLQFVVPEGIY